MLGLSPSAHTKTPLLADNEFVGLPKESNSMAAPFTIGLESPCPVKTCRKKKEQSGGHKKTKHARMTLGKENMDTKEKSSREDGQLNGKDVNMETLEVGEKRKESIPMMELSLLTENIKKQKVEEEV